MTGRWSVAWVGFLSSGPGALGFSGGASGLCVCACCGEGECFHPRLTDRLVLGRHALLRRVVDGRAVRKRAGPSGRLSLPLQEEQEVASTRVGGAGFRPAT